MKSAYWLALLAFVPAAGRAADYCPERPGLDTPPCVVGEGRVSVEIGLADWTLEKDDVLRTDTILAVDTEVRIGLTDSIEAQVEWMPYGHVRTRDRASGTIDRVSRVGDVRIGAKWNLANPDGSGASIALLPFATVPVGRSPVGMGDWGGGLIVPASYEIRDGLSLAASPEIDAAVDEDGDGRHLAYGSVVGLNVDLSKAMTASIELSAFRDRDPDGHANLLLAGLSAGWQPADDLQLDAGVNAGLNHDSPDVEVYAGISRRF